MTIPTLSPGCIIHWEDFEFSDGTTADKYLVIVGCKQSSNYLAVLGTSKRRKKNFQPGCNHYDGYYHTPAGFTWFPKDTWLILSNPIEINPSEFLKRAMVDKTLKICGQIPDKIANEIRNCLKLCRDVSAAHLMLL